MTVRIRMSVAALVLALSALGAAAYAQVLTKVEIGFPFVARGVEMAPGSYTIEFSQAGPLVLSSSTPSRARTVDRVVMPTITRLGRHDTDAEPELVFDKIDGKFHLSEVWLPGRDGYLLLGTKEQHDHRILGGPLGKK
jgi:hypothetical protein